VLFYCINSQSCERQINKSSGGVAPNKNGWQKGRKMKREELVAMGLNDEQIETIMADMGKSIQKANSLVEKYKSDAEKMAELQKQLDEINSANMTEIEKANSETTKANEKVALLEKQLKTMQTKNDLASIGIVGEEADKIVNSFNDGVLDIATLGAFISAREKNAVSEFEKKALDKTPNPQGGDGNGNDNGSDVLAKSIAQNIVGNNKTSESIISSYL